MSAEYDMDRGMRASLDWLRAAADPRVVAVVLARDWGNERTSGPVDWTPVQFSWSLERYGITATENQARALLDAVAAWDETLAGCPGAKCQSPGHPLARAHLTAAVTAIVGEQR